MGKRRTLKYHRGCLVMKTASKGRVYFKCQNMKRSPSAQEIINSLK